MMNVQPESGVKMPVSQFKSFDLLQSMPPRCFALPAGGSAWEWVTDWYAMDYYRNSSDRNPTGPSRSGSKVLRGGSPYSRLLDPRTGITSCRRNSCSTSTFGVSRAVQNRSCKLALG